MRIGILTAHAASQAGGTFVGSVVASKSELVALKSWVVAAAVGFPGLGVVSPCEPSYASGLRPVNRSVGVPKKPKKRNPNVPEARHACATQQCGRHWHLDFSAQLSRPSCPSRLAASFPMSKFRQCPQFCRLAAPVREAENSLSPVSPPAPNHRDIGSPGQVSPSGRPGTQVGGRHRHHQRMANGFQSPNPRLENFVSAKTSLSSRVRSPGYVIGHEALDCSIFQAAPGSLICQESEAMSSML